MLKKIISIKNVGRFVSSALPGVPACAKYTQILGANGYGKTTICSIMRSLGTNDPALIAGRTRVGSKAPAQIELLLDGITAKFEDGAWSTNAPEIIVFDGAFIAENVHSGDVVDLEQRRNLYRVIVGTEGVGLALEEERLANESRGKGSEINAVEKAIRSHVPPGMRLDDFLKLPADSDIDAKIATQTMALNAVREADQLKTRAPMSEAPFPTLPSDFEALLGKTLDGIAEDAQKRIDDHVSMEWLLMARNGCRKEWITSPAIAAPSAGNRSRESRLLRLTERCLARPIGK
jgi:wobble nucleotide-excising tRNase